MIATRAFAAATILACLLSAGCLGKPPASPTPDSFVDHAGWSEYVPMWKVGPATLSYHGHGLKIGANETYATDGAAYLYVTRSDARDATVAAACRAGQRQASGEWVLLVAEGCVWVGYPGLACDKSAACDEIG